MPRPLRSAPLIAMVAALLALTGCAPAAEEPQQAPPPTLGFLVGYAGECSGPGGEITVDSIRSQADELVRTRLRQAGYTTLLVPCDEPVPAVDDAELRRYLDERGLRVERVRVDDARVASAIAGGTPAHALRSAISRRIMLAESLVFSGEIARLPSASLELIADRQAIELARDDRRVPGAPVGGDEQVYSRAIGESGLLVSLSRGGPESSPEVSVAIADLNLAGDDSVPATDVWTGRRIHSVDGRLAVTLSPGDTALLRIG
ncbi:hypothetical protein [Gordonia iterans]